MCYSLNIVFLCIDYYGEVVATLMCAFLSEIYQVRKITKDDSRTRLGCKIIRFFFFFFIPTALFHWEGVPSMSRSSTKTERETNKKFAIILRINMRERGLVGIRIIYNSWLYYRWMNIKRNLTTQQHKEEPSNIPPQTLEFSQ